MMVLSEMVVMVGRVWLGEGIIIMTISILIVLKSFGVGVMVIIYIVVKKVVVVD